MTGSTEKTVPTTSDTQTTTGPLAGTQTGLVNTYNGVLGALNSYNSTPYQGATVAPLSSTTTGLVGNAAALGSSAASYSPAISSSLLGQVTDGTINQNASNLYNAAVGTQAQGVGSAYGVSGTAQGANNSIGGITGSLSDIANGSLLTNGGANQQFMNLYTPAANAVTEQYETGTQPGINSQYALAGRNGSGAEAAATAGAQNTYKQDLNNLASSALSQTYSTDLGAQSTDAGLVGSLAGQQVTNSATGNSAVQSALSNLANQQTTTASGLQGQTTSSAQTQQSAATALANTNETQMQSVLGSLQASGLVDANTQAELSGAISQYYAGNNQALTKYSQFIPLLTQIASLGSSGTKDTQGTTTVYGASPLSQGISTAGSLASLGTSVAGLL
jgi:hypothetical protein